MSKPLRHFLLLAAAALIGCTPATLSGQPATASAGISGRQTATLDGTPFEVFTWQPTGCTPRAILLVFHGMGRNAAGFRDDAVPVARRGCMAVVAPLFDATRFKNWAYQRGGIVHHGALLPEDQWTVRYAASLADWARRQQAAPGLPYLQLGHSAGAQFLSRVVAYAPGAARLTVIANPSTWVEPSLDVAAPYGFGNLPGGEAALRRYLAAPVLVLLGGSDHGTRDLATSREASDQGADRLGRGRNAFAAAEAAARQHGWPFGWTLAVVPGVGHDARAMFTSAAAFAALEPP